MWTFPPRKFLNIVITIIAKVVIILSLSNRLWSWLIQINFQKKIQNFSTSTYESFQLNYISGPAMTIWLFWLQDVKVLIIWLGTMDFIFNKFVHCLLFKHKCLKVKEIIIQVWSQQKRWLEISANICFLQWWSSKILIADLLSRTQLRCEDKATKPKKCCCNEISIAAEAKVKIIL